MSVLLVTVDDLLASSGVKVSAILITVQLCSTKGEPPIQQAV